MSYQGPERRSQITFTREDSDRLVRLEEQLISSDEKLDTMIKTMADATVAANRKADQLEDRVSKLERKQSWMIGIGTAIGFILSLLAEALVELWRK